VIARLRTRRGLLIVGGGGLVVLLAALVAVYFLLFPTSSAERFTIKTKSRGSAASGADAADGSVGGNWVIGSGSKAGYRVREKLAFLPAQSDAVGRTSAITGDATLKTSGNRVTIRAAAFKVDVSKLASDNGRRDQRIHQIGLESDRYPTASFKLSKPIELGRDATAGKLVKVRATGAFTIHGTSKTETVPLELRLTDTALQAVGSLTFPWSEFGMTAPSIAGFVNVKDKATMEFDLRLRSS
jgi:polyisoprenoid-binding protein YceI